jgi:predicted N-formylglutamate amidohydrolase
MYAMSLHGQRHNVVYLELEVRQDLLGTPEDIVDVADRLCDALTALQVRTG